MTYDASRSALGTQLIALLQLFRCLRYTCRGAFHRLDPSVLSLANKVALPVSLALYIKCPPLAHPAFRILLCWSVVFFAVARYARPNGRLAYDLLRELRRIDADHDLVSSRTIGEWIERAYPGDFTIHNNSLLMRVPAAIH